MAELLGLAWDAWLMGIIVIVLSVVTAYIFIWKVVGALRQYLDRYIGDHKLSDALIRLLGLSILFSALDIGFNNLQIQYISTVLEPIIDVALMALSMLRWGVYIAALLFIGFAIYHASTKTKGAEPAAQQQYQQPQQ
ncbi:MAG: hypothetical protein ABIG20_03260 [archaeon]